jgi:hypothetical protein
LYGRNCDEREDITLLVSVDALIFSATVVFEIVCPNITDRKFLDQAVLHQVFVFSATPSPGDPGVF